jgi:hypothetical protein
MNMTLPTAFVRILANWFYVLTWLISVVPLSTHSITKWYLVSLCLLCSWWTRFLLRDMEDLLSSRRLTFGARIPSSSLNRRLSQIPWQAVFALAMYSASHDDIATTSCFYDTHVTKFIPIKKIEPRSHRRSDRLPESPPPQAELHLAWSHRRSDRLTWGNLR